MNSPKPSRGRDEPAVGVVVSVSISSVGGWLPLAMVMALAPGLDGFESAIEYASVGVAATYELDLDVFWFFFSLLFNIFSFN